MDNNQYRDNRSTINPVSLTIYVIIPLIIVIGYWYGTNHWDEAITSAWWFCLFFGFGRVFAILSLIINGPLTVLRLMNMSYDKRHGLR